MTMLRFMVDEDFNDRVVRGVYRLLPALELVRIQELGMVSAGDREILEAAAQTGRLLLTHDAKTMPAYAYERVKAGQTMPGLVVCPQHLAIGAAIADIVLLAECSEDDEWDGKVVYLPILRR
jgi:hypothetical protein